MRKVLTILLANPLIVLVVYFVSITLYVEIGSNFSQRSDLYLFATLRGIITFVATLTFNYLLLKTSKFDFFILLKVVLIAYFLTYVTLLLLEIVMKSPSPWMYSSAIYFPFPGIFGGDEGI